MGRSAGGLCVRQLLRCVVNYGIATITSHSGAQVPMAFHLMAKPIGPICNLGCSYCFYLEKEKLYPQGENFRMSDEALETFVRQYIETQDVPEVTFAWQGGEPTLLGVEFFRKAVKLQRQYANGKRIQNALQTNGTRLDGEWCEFLLAEKFLVGLSIDGPPKLHNAYRVDKRGRGTYDTVLRGLRLLQKHGVEYNTLTVVNRMNSRHPLEVYRFLRGLGSRFMQFIPLVERVPDAAAAGLGLDLAMPPGTDGEGARRLPVTEWSVEPGQYGEFLCAIFDEWLERDVGRIFVQLFDVTLGNHLRGGHEGALCFFSETCGGALAIEHNGDVYSCDHYVYPQFKLGNILNNALGDMVSSDFQRAFGQAKSSTLPRYCRECEVRHLCHGECPKHRFLRTPDGEPGLNYLCRAYKRFFTHSAPALRHMAGAIASR